MKQFIISLILLTLGSCQESNQKYDEVILENRVINTEFLQTMNTPEKALLTCYLYAYGNECISNSTSSKCNILEFLQIKNECEAQHIDFLKKWFKKEVLMKHKLQKCPNLPHTFAIQNTFEKIVMRRNLDTISITIEVKGINEFQEKNWNIEQTDSYLIINDVFIKV